MMSQRSPRGLRSLPSRERGLKCSKDAVDGLDVHVAPFTGAWIEIPVLSSIHPAMRVAPFTGAWIEIKPGRSPRRTFSGRSLHGSVD